MGSLPECDKQEKHTMSFFFQAEDGIRDHCVTGVQTCALPISPVGWRVERLDGMSSPVPRGTLATRRFAVTVAADAPRSQARSEERRVGKECKSPEGGSCKKGKP